VYLLCVRNTRSVRKHLFTQPRPAALIGVGVIAESALKIKLKDKSKEMKNFPKRQRNYSCKFSGVQPRVVTMKFLGSARSLPNIVILIDKKVIPTLGDEFWRKRSMKKFWSLETNIER
jgi:hypothetical protein